MYRLQETGRGNPPPRRETYEEKEANLNKWLRMMDQKRKRRDQAYIKAAQERYMIIQGVEQKLNIKGKIYAINRKLQLGRLIWESNAECKALGFKGVATVHHGYSAHEWGYEMRDKLNPNFSYQAWSIEDKRTEERSGVGYWRQEPGHLRIYNAITHTQTLSSVQWRASLWFDLEDYKDPGEFYERFGHLGQLFGNVMRIHHCDGNHCHKPDIHAQGNLNPERFPIDVNNPEASKQIFRDQLFSVFTA